jgi:hypothetical protein
MPVSWFTIFRTKFTCDTNYNYSMRVKGKVPMLITDNERSVQTASSQDLIRMHGRNATTATENISQRRRSLSLSVYVSTQLMNQAKPRQSLLLRRIINEMR